MYSTMKAKHIISVGALGLIVVFTFRCIYYTNVVEINPGTKSIKQSERESEQYKDCEEDAHNYFRNLIDPQKFAIIFLILCYAVSFYLEDHVKIIIITLLPHIVLAIVQILWFKIGYDWIFIDLCFSCDNNQTVPLVVNNADSLKHSYLHEVAINFGTIIYYCLCLLCTLLSYHKKSWTAHAENADSSLLQTA